MKVTINKTIILSLLFLFIGCGVGIFTSFAGDIQFELTVDSNTVPLGSSVQLNLSLYGIRNMPAPRIDKIDGFDVHYLGPSTRMSIVNGNISVSVTHIYRLLPLKTGVFKIGPFSVKHKGKIITSNSATIKVVSSGSAPSASKGNTQPRGLNEKELSDRIFLTMEPAKAKVYLNESIPLTIKLYINHFAVRDIQYPQFKHEGFSTAKFGKPRQYRETLDGVLYDVIEFDTRMFAVKPGKMILGPAVMQCNLVIKKKPRGGHSSFDDLFGGAFDNSVFDDFFGGYELYPFRVTSPEITVNVLSLPEEGKPSSFKGAVGDFRMEAKVSSHEVNAGDPVTLTATIKGKGNFDTVFPLKIKFQKGFKIYEPHRKQVDGAKIFEQILIPESEDIKSIPEVSFSFFNPGDGSYHTINKGPFPIIVKASENAEPKVLEMPKAGGIYHREEHLGKDIVYIKEDIGHLIKKGEYIYRKPGYWFFQIAALLIFIVLFSVHGYNQKLKNDVQYARRLAAPRKARGGIKAAGELLKDNNTVNFFDVVFTTIRGYLSDRLRIPPGSVTHNMTDEVLRSRGVSENICSKIRSIFDSCDTARFSPSDFNKEKMEGVFKDMREVIDYMEKNKV